MQRAKELATQNVELPATKTLQYFLYNQISKENFTDKTLEVFSRLDDYDVLSAIKEWTTHSDQVLSELSKMIMNRNLLKIKIQDQNFTKEEINIQVNKLISKNNILIGFFV